MNEMNLFLRRGILTSSKTFVKEDRVTISPSLERSQLMEDDTKLVTRDQYIVMLIDASFWDASEMESSFTSWCKQHVPTWGKQGYDEPLIHQRTDRPFEILSCSSHESF